MAKRSLVALLAGLLVGVAGGADARILVVDDDGADCPNPDASTLDVAVMLAGPGDTIRVCLGEYAGGVVVDKAGVMIKAQGPLGSVKVTGPGVGGPRFGFAVVASRVRIEGFEIYGFDGQADAAGIAVGGLFPDSPAHGAVIVNNDIHDNANGISLWQSNNNVIEHNTVHHHRAVRGGGGTGLVSLAGLGDSQVAAANALGRSGRNNEIRQNVVYDNERRGILVGACADAAPACLGPLRVFAEIGGTTIEHNEVFGNGADGFEGIGVLHARHGVILQNWVHDNAFDGVLVAFADGTLVKRNRAKKNSGAGRGFAGIRILASTRVSVQGNESDDNELGIRISRSTDGVFAKNAADHNSVLDLEWDGSGTHTFSNNRCSLARALRAASNCP